MKKIITLLTISVLLTNCADQKQETTQEVIASENAEAIQKRRDKIVLLQQEINTQIKALDKALAALSPEENMPLITSFTANNKVFKHYVELQGSVETDQNILITPEMGGVLKKVHVTKGQRVKKGQLLASIDDGGMSQSLAQMQVQVSLAKTTFERQERLWNPKTLEAKFNIFKQKTAYEGQLNAVNSMEQQVAKASIKAPFSGTIDDIITEKGNVVAPGQTPILRIVSLENMYVKTDVPETYISSIVAGKQVEVFFPVLEETFMAVVSQTGNFINPNNRTFRAEINVENTKNNIKPNLTSRLKINDYTNKNAIVIPQSIISENAAGEQYIYVLKQINNDNASGESGDY